MTRRFPLLSLAAASIFFAAMAVLVRVAGQRGYGTAQLVVFRMTFNGLGCLPFLFRRGETLRVTRPGLLLIRSILGGAAIVSYFLSIALLPVGLATLFNYLGPLFTTLLAAQFLGERPGSRLVIGIFVAFAGAALTVRGLAGAGILGVGVGLSSAVLQGAAVTMIRKLRATESAVTILFWFSIVTTALSLPFALVHARVPPPADLPVLIGLGLSSLLAQLLFTGALGHVPAATYSLLSPITPATAFALGALILGEPITPRVLAGACLAVVGVAIGTLRLGQRQLPLETEELSGDPPVV